MIPTVFTSFMRFLQIFEVFFDLFSSRWGAF